jgi:hypothetical protein
VPHVKFPAYLILSLLGLPTAGYAASGGTLPGVACHVSYGGETRIVRAAASRDPYTVPAVAIGSYFLFRVVFEHPARRLPGIKLYTYADRDEGAVPIHIAHFPHPSHTSARGTRFGFTGEQFVFEPVRDGELHYWCELERGAPTRAARR